MLRRFFLLAGLGAAAVGQTGAQTTLATNPGPAENGAARPAAASAPTVYFTADELPGFPGGDAALLPLPTAVTHRVDWLSGKGFS